MKVHTNPHAATAERVAWDVRFVAWSGSVNGTNIRAALHRRIPRGSIPEPEWLGIVRLVEAELARDRPSPRTTPPPVPQPPRSVA
jgi:hypothetical protein